MNQHEWVYSCYEYYLENYIEPGNPEDGVWENAHWPVPECKGGSKTIPLLKEHHAVHGVLQSEEWQHPCIWGWEKAYLKGELLALCEKWISVQRSLAAKAGRSMLTPAERSRRVQKGHASRTPAERKAIAQRLSARRTAEERSEAARRGRAALTPEQRSNATRRGNAARDPQARSEIARKGNATRGPDGRSASARKGWETRRRNAGLT